MKYAEKVPNQRYHPAFPNGLTETFLLQLHMFPRVSFGPGFMQLTRMLLSPSSHAACLQRQIIASFDTQYAISFFIGLKY
jgi:hypothetical protein